MFDEAFATAVVSLMSMLLEGTIVASVQLLGLFLIHCLWSNYVLQCPNVKSHQPRQAGGFCYAPAQASYLQTGIIKAPISLEMAHPSVSIYLSSTALEWWPYVSAHCTI